MARVIEVSLADEAAYRIWLAERPPVVRAVAERFDPWSLYRHRKTGQIVMVCGFFEDGTVTMLVSAEFNRQPEGFPQQFFVPGVNPDDLEPCEVPAADQVAKIDRGLLH